MPLQSWDACRIVHVHVSALRNRHFVLKLHHYPLDESVQMSVVDLRQGCTTTSVVHHDMPTTVYEVDDGGRAVR